MTYSFHINQTLSKAELSRKHTVKTTMTCECGKVTFAGPMKKHTNSTGHTATRND